jgi:hypothetical protein
MMCHIDRHEAQDGLLSPTRGGMPDIQRARIAQDRRTDLALTSSTFPHDLSLNCLLGRSNH